MQTFADDLQKDIALRLETLQQKLEWRPADAALYNEFGIAMAAGGRIEGALSAFEQAAKLCPGFAEAWFNAGLAFELLSRVSEAFVAFERACQLAPNYRAAREKAVEIGARLGRRPERDLWQRKQSFWGRLRGRANTPVAIPSLGADAPTTEEGFREAIVGNPNDAALLISFGCWLMRRERLVDAELYLDYALTLKPGDDVGTLALASIRERTHRISDAIQVLEAARALTADPRIVVELLRLRLLVCDWRELDTLLTESVAALRRDPGCCNPYFSLLLPTTLADQRRCAEWYAARSCSGVEPLPAPVVVRERRAINIGYMSADFHQHAVATLMAELPELHDRNKFHVTGYGLWLNDGSVYGKRLRGSFDRYVDFYGASARNAAAKIREDEIDILIDLNGYTSNARPEILAHRAAPIQVNFLGYPGTLGADFVDYIIVDKTVAPEEHARWYTERLVRMPHTYQINDRKRARPPKYRLRSDCDLPKDGMVFCNFSDPTRILPSMFEIWARILNRVPGSVLWLLAGSPVARDNLCAEGATRGIASERLIFAPSASHAEHMARYWHADLFLDTSPYNAHTTCSEALWMGCPVLTCLGDTFAGRVAASLLRAAGLPGLVASTMDDYETMAVRMAHDAAERRSIRKTLQVQRNSCALFDSRSYVRSLEWAFNKMFDQFQSGQTPATFTVPPQI
jgi:predicted O-linked N-acetylglucosamine transferase (SPINDLY family)